jgi:hypothetical protein
MKTAPSCNVRHLDRDGVAHPLLPYGAETRWGRSARPTGRCHDCGVEPGGFHHLGCDVAECPVCRGQLFICDCRFDGEVDEGEEEEDDEFVG